MPATNIATTQRNSQRKAGMMALFHAPPIWLTMFLAVAHATSFAVAGSRLLDDRKKRRVKVMKVKVWAIAHASAKAFVIRNP